MARIVKRSISIAGHKTSISLEQEFFTRLKQLAAMQNKTMGTLVAQIDKTKEKNLSSELRVYILEHESFRLGEKLGERRAESSSDSTLGATRFSSP